MEPAYSIHSVGVTRTVTDSIGGRGLNARGGRIIGGFNAAPIAAFNVPDRVFADASKRFDGSASDDDDGDALSYSWDIGATGTIDATGPTPELTFGSVGTHDLRLTVSDGSATDSVTKSVDVSDPVIDSVEDGDLAEWDQSDSSSNSNPRWSATDAYAAHDGSWTAYLSASTDNVDAVSTSGLPVYPQRGEDFHTAFKASNVSEVNIYQKFFYKDSNNHYRVDLLGRSGSFRLVAFENGNGTVLGSTDLPMDSGAYHVSRITTSNEPTITAELIDPSTGDVLRAVQGDHTAYDTGGVAYSCAPTSTGSDIWVDDWRIV